MTTPETIRSYSDFCLCVEWAPEGTYTAQKTLRAMIRETLEPLLQDLNARGMSIGTDSNVFRLEAAVYDYIRTVNPDATLFPLGEGFGAALSTPARDRVLAQAERDRDALRQIQANGNNS